MNTGYRYNQYQRDSGIWDFSYLRTITRCAGMLGVFQSIIWIGLTITGILAYNCIIPIEDVVSYGSIIKFVFFELYFHRNCNPNVYASVNYDVMNTAKTVLSPQDIFICVCVYLAIAVCWLLSSSLLLTNIKEESIRRTKNTLYAWIFVTFLICAFDLGLGVLFGIDYGRFKHRAYAYNLATYLAGNRDPDAVQLIAAQIATISMMIISLKGFVLWLANCGLTIYLLKQALVIGGSKNKNDNLFAPRRNSDDIIVTGPPISAFESKPNSVFSNEAFVSDNRYSTSTFELNQESIARAARMTMDHLQGYRFRNIDNFQQYPPPSSTNENSIKSNVTPTTTTFAVATALPSPDYTPPMARTNPTTQNNGILRNTRYQ